MKKIVLFAAACFVLSGSVFCQIKSTLRPGENVKAIFIAMDDADIHWQTLMRGAQQEAARSKIEFTNNAPTSKTDPAQQITLVENAITAKYDIIMLAPQNADRLVPVVNKAKAAGIKMIILDSPIGNGANFDTFVGTDNAAAARTAADTLAKAIGGKGKIAVINSRSGVPAAVTREQEFKDRITKNYPNITIVGSQYSDGDKTKAQSIAGSFIQANSDLAGIYACNDAATIGAANAVKQAGKAGKIIVVGWEKNKELENLVKDGTIHSVMVQNSSVMGARAIQAGINLIQGKPVGKSVDSGITVGNKANIGKL
ncbi:MAG: substrate-binding domain-containing protein [Treponema sp.]|nr:substrate-binding domain-containing protein [Treponema sp.]